VNKLAEDRFHRWAFVYLVIKPLRFMNNIGPTYKTTQHHNQGDLKAKRHTSKSEQTVTLF